MVLLTEDSGRLDLSSDRDGHGRDIDLPSISIENDRTQKTYTLLLLLVITLLKKHPDSFYYVRFWGRGVTRVQLCIIKGSREKLPVF